MADNPIKTQIRQMVSKYTEGRSFSDTQDLITQGFVNSFEAAQLVTQFEKTFHLKISDAETKNLRTIDAIAAFVQRKVG